MYTQKVINLKVNKTTFQCTVWFDFIEGYPAKLTGHPDYQYAGKANEYVIQSLSMNDTEAWYKADFLIDALADEIEAELEKLL